MRTYHKSWQSERPMTRTTRRVKMYVGEFDVRLKFEDEFGVVNTYHDVCDQSFTMLNNEAQELWDAFKRGGITTQGIRDRMRATGRQS